jgi:hypothetical protein
MSKGDPSLYGSLRGLKINKPLSYDGARINMDGWQETLARLNANREPRERQQGRRSPPRTAYRSPPRTAPRTAYRSPPRTAHRSPPRTAHRSPPRTAHRSPPRTVDRSQPNTSCLARTRQPTCPGLTQFIYEQYGTLDVPDANINTATRKYKGVFHPDKNQSCLAEATQKSALFNNVATDCSTELKSRRRGGGTKKKRRYKNKSYSNKKNR